MRVGKPGNCFCLESEKLNWCYGERERAAGNMGCAPIQLQYGSYTGLIWRLATCSKIIDN